MHLRARVEAISGENRTEETERRLFDLQDPQFWNLHVKDNAEVGYEVGFEKLLIAISERTNERVDEISTFRFYAMMEYLKESAPKTGR